MCLQYHLFLASMGFVLLADDAYATLQVQAWPGNIRQLKNVVERILILAAGDPSEAITADMLPPDASGTPPAGGLGAEVSLVGRIGADPFGECAAAWSARCPGRRTMNGQPKRKLKGRDAV